MKDEREDCMFVDKDTFHLAHALFMVLTVIHVCIFMAGILLVDAVVLPLAIVLIAYGLLGTIVFGFFENEFDR